MSTPLKQLSSTDHGSEEKPYFAARFCFLSLSLAFNLTKTSCQKTHLESDLDKEKCKEIDRNTWFISMRLASLISKVLIFLMIRTRNTCVHDNSDWTTFEILAVGTGRDILVSKSEKINMLLNLARLLNLWGIFAVRPDGRKFSQLKMTKRFGQAMVLTTTPFEVSLQ